MLPSPLILKSLGERFGVPVIRERIFGQDYAKTLATWRNNFRAAWPNLTPLGFDDRFRRLWEYYLAYCEAGFLSGNIDVRQVVFAKAVAGLRPQRTNQPQNRLPLSIALYCGGPLN